MFGSSTGAAETKNERALLGQGRSFKINPVAFQGVRQFWSMKSGFEVFWLPNINAIIVVGRMIGVVNIFERYHMQADGGLAC